MISIILFYDKSAGKQGRYAFSKEFRHCDCICYDGDAAVQIELRKTGIEYRRVRMEDPLVILRLQRAARVIKELVATVTVNVGDKHVSAWWPWWVRTCNEVTRYTTGVDVGLTINPAHFYKKLFRYDGKRNYQILDAWRR